MTPDATHAAVLRRWILEGRLWASERAAIERAIEKLTELSQCSSCGSYERIVRQPPMTLDLAEFRAWACSGNCKNVYQAHYGKHEPNCRGDEILELCDEVERLRDFDQQTFRNTIKLRAERDAAQAENERLRHDNAELALYRELDKGERDAGLAWRACADQLAARLRLRAASPGNPDREALAEYERLKGTT